MGALATQALVNPMYGLAGLDLLAAGQAPARVIEALVAADPGRDVRQLHVIGATGPAAGYTGAQCVDWCGHVAFDDFSVAGNMLAGPRVVEDTADAYQRTLSCRSLNACSRRSTPAKQPAATSVASKRPHCGS